MADDECKKQECPPGAPIWMCTFADLMSLLLCFFVLLLSFSVMDVTKYKQVAGAMKDAFGVQSEPPVTEEMKGRQMVSTTFESVPLHVQVLVARHFSEELDSGKLEAEYSGEGLILRVKGDVAFESGKAQIRNDFLPLLDKLGKIIPDMDLAVEVGGHTDNVPIRKGVSTFSTNWGLSSARSIAVVEYWIEKFRIPGQKLSAKAYADSRPIATNGTPEGRSKNRRVEFKIKPENPEIVVTGIEIDETPINEISPPSHK
ncbi:MAG: OmpA family protein [Desulfobulbaceae bacterium]|uniref:OmpA family protein n=1 Tax=Candidatus Desulfobia pelagia TaxID=2841692 RepID=A0A8J6TCZ3_9BACT|nr:OmpA family protein [Candidatus Desulfobia pelagia]